MNKCFFSIIVCTLGERLKDINILLQSLEKQTFADFDVIIVSQNNHEDIENVLLKSNLEIKHIKSDTIGLSRARNVALPYASGKFITISDDDCWYPKNALFDVFNYVKENEQLDALSFQIFDFKNKVMYKKYPNNSIIKHRFNIGNVSSIEIFFKNSFIKKKGIKFDENYGLGSINPFGEENIFLSDLLVSKGKIKYFPRVVVYHLSPDKNKFILDLDKLRSKRNVFKRIFGEVLGVLIYYIFCIKHFKKIVNKRDIL